MAKKQDDYSWNKNRIAVLKGYIQQRVYPNYHKIREDMGMSVDPKCMASKKKALNKMLAEMCNFRIEGKGKGQHYIFDSMKDKVECRADNRGKKGEFIDDVKGMLIYSILESDRDNKGVVILTPNVLMRKCNMFNNNFINAYHDIPIASQLVGKTVEQMQDYKRIARGMMLTNTKTGLNSLMKDAKVNYSYIMCVYAGEEVDEELIETGDNSVIIKKSYGNYENRQATDEEVRIILDIHQEIFKELNESIKERKSTVKTIKGIADVQGVYWEIFKSKFKKKLKQRAPHIKSAYNGFKIIYASNLIDELYCLEEKEVIASRLNDNILEKLSTNADTRHKKALKIGFGKTNELHMLRKSDTYVEDFDYLASIFNDEEAENIINENSIKKLKEENKKINKK